MPTESSAVSSLIRHVHSRRLDTDPGDHALFGRTSVAQPPARIAPLRPLALGTNPPPTQKRYPTLPRGKRRRWPLVVSALFACGLGVGGAAYLAEVLELRGPAPHAAASVAPSQVTPLPTSTPAPTATPTPTPTATPVTAEPLPAPAPAPIAADTTTTTTEPAKTTPAKRTKGKRAVTRRSKRSRAKEATVEPALPAELTPHAAAPAPAAEPEPAPPPPSAPPRKQKQAADTENPL